MKLGMILPFRVEFGTQRILNSHWSWLIYFKEGKWISCQGCSLVHGWWPPGDFAKQNSGHSGKERCDHLAMFAVSSEKGRQSLVFCFGCTMETDLQGLEGLSQSHAKLVIGIANTEGV